ncbi:MAG: type II secretion system protein [Phycisphaerae bacterium]|nr:type II secretion system protein [Phycisphaerae bacterium]MDD5381619.1 type II secretion system protein [Phycisphaerae bacterium]
MKKAFTLVELLIVVAILGILAAMTVPIFQNHIEKAKESAAKDNLRTLRNAIELYAAQHNGFPPGYINGTLNPVPTTVTRQLCWATTPDGVSAPRGTAGYPLGPYLPTIPKNPFNDKNTMQVLGPATLFPDPPTGAFGWIYKPSIKAIKVDDKGTDSKGVKHYDY